jgi:hypothetical protein
VEFRVPDWQRSNSLKLSSIENSGTLKARSNSPFPDIEDDHGVTILKVLISDKGRMHFNGPLTRLFSSYGAERVLLMSDGHQKIALQPLKKRAKRDDHAHTVTYHSNQRQAAVSATDFLRTLGWDGGRYQLDAHWNEGSSLLEFSVPAWQYGSHKVRSVESSGGGSTLRARNSASLADVKDRHGLHRIQ